MTSRLAIVLGVAVAVLVNVVVAAVLGAPGTAAAIALGQSITAAAAILLGRRRLVLPVTWGRVAATIAVAVTVVIGSTLIPGVPLAVRLGLAAMLAVALVLEGTLPAWFATVARRRRTGADA